MTSAADDAPPLPFPYQPLNPSVPEIRLLQLLPHKDNNNAVQLTLTHASLHNNDPSSLLLPPLPQYTALSYFWGVKATKCITVDGHSVVVSDGLYAALWQLQMQMQLRDETVGEDAGGSPEVDAETRRRVGVGYAGLPRRLWVDAVCINQDDAVEKSQQVKLMHDIYTKATDVLVWLGPGTTETDSMMRAVTSFGGVLLKAGIDRIQAADLDHLRSWTDNDDGGDDDDDLNNLLTVKRAIKAQFERVLDGVRRNDDAELSWCRSSLSVPWFSRVWVLQECALGQRVVFACGRERVEFDQLWAVAFFSKLFATWSGLHDAWPSLCDASIARVGDISNALPSRTLGLRRLHWKRPNDAQLSLKCLLCRANVLRSDGRRAQATKPVDRVYAVLALANDATAVPVVPDYVSSCANAYMRTAQMLLQAGHLDVLGLCRKRLIPDKAELPSWAPDWHAENCQPWMLYREDAFFRASGDFAAQLSFADLAGQSVLSMSGVALGAIARVGQVWSISLEASITDHLQELVTMFTDLADCAAKSKRYSHEQKMNLIWRAPICDLIGDGEANQPRRATGDSKIGFWATYTLAEGRPDWYAAHPEARLPNVAYTGRLRRMHDARPFLLDTGYVGMCPMETEPNDVLVVFLGGHVPYVLRPNGDLWTLVGEAYAYGAMDGEAMADGCMLETFRIV